MNEENKKSNTGVFNEEEFSKRYLEDTVDSNMLSGSLSLVNSYFIENKLPLKQPEILNHPLNLDQLTTEGMGFTKYCRAFKVKDDQAIMSVAFAFNDYMIKTYGFKLYIDQHPENPLQTMTLAYIDEDTPVFLYPLEYTLKVLRSEASFSAINLQIKDTLDTLSQTEGNSGD